MYRWGHLESSPTMSGEKTEDEQAMKPAREPTHSADLTHMTNWFTLATSHSSHCCTWCTHESAIKTQPSAHTGRWHVWLETADTMSGFTKTRVETERREEGWKQRQRVGWGRKNQGKRERMRREKCERGSGQERKERQELWSGGAAHKVARWAPA